LRFTTQKIKHFSLKKSLQIYDKLFDNQTLREIFWTRKFFVATNILRHTYYLTAILKIKGLYPDTF